MDRWLNAKTVDFSDLPVAAPPVGRAAMNAARPVEDVPPNMPAWPRLAWRGNVRPDMPHDPHERDGW